MQNKEMSLFQLEPVILQFHVSDIIDLAVCNNVLVIALGAGVLLYIDLEFPEKVTSIEVFKRPTFDQKILKVFIDPSGNHLLISCTNGETHYCHKSWTKSKSVVKLKGFGLRLVAWNEFSNEYSTMETLISGSDGHLYETLFDTRDLLFRREDKYLKLVYSSEHPITGIFAHAVDGEKSLHRLLLSTSRRLYQWNGAIKRKNNEAKPIYPAFFSTSESSYREFPVSFGDGRLILGPKSQAGNFTAFAWMCGSGVYYGRFYDEESNSPLSDCFAEASLLRDIIVPHNAPCILTKYRILSINGDDIIMGSLINGKRCAEEAFGQTKPIHALGIVADIECSTFWVYTDLLLFELISVNEDRDVWKEYLDQGKWKEAMEFAKTPSERAAVDAAYANFLIAEERFEEAADIY